MPAMAGSQRNLDVSGGLIARCQEGDSDAFRRLFEQTCGDVQRILFRLAGGQDLEDLVQQAYLALFGAIRRFEGRSAFSTFVYGICLKVAQKRARGLRRFLRLRESYRIEPRESQGSPGEQAERAARVFQVQQSLERLSWKLRTVLVLYEMEELPGAEIAVQLGIPEATVWTRLHHARKAFRRSYSWVTSQEGVSCSPGSSPT